jgi:hypothetical protein
MSDSLFEQLRANLDARAHAALVPPVAMVARVREALDHYEAALRTHTEGALLAPVFAALSVTPPADPLPGAVEHLKAALELLQAQFQLPVVAATTELSEPPVFVAPALGESSVTRMETILLDSRPSPRAPIYPDPTPAELEHARTFLEEMAETDFESQHVLRLEPLLQALVADARLAMERVPPTHALHRRLDGAISRLGGLRRDLGVTGFVKGLSRDHRADWERVAREARRRVQAFDEDVEATTAVVPVREKKEVVATSEPKVEAKPIPRADDSAPGERKSENSREWPVLDALRARLAEAPLFLVGGLRVEEKLTLVRDRFGLEPEWHEIYHGAPRATAAIAKRIRRGKIGAVVLLEGLTGHSNADEVVAACKASDVPFALADRAGSGSLQEAFEALDRQCREPAAE